MLILRVLLIIHAGGEKPRVGGTLTSHRQASFSVCSGEQTLRPGWGGVTGKGVSLMLGLLWPKD